MPKPNTSLINIFDDERRRQMKLYMVLEVHYGGV